MNKIAGLFVVISSMLTAQHQMSLLDCENAFQTNNLQLLAEQYNINIADADILQAKIWELPQLNGYVNGYNPENRKVFNVGKAKGFEVTQLIYMGGKKKTKLLLQNPIKNWRNCSFLNCWWN